MKFKIQMSQVVLDFVFWKFEFVSYLVLRISNFFMIMTNGKKKSRVLTALSGGVDSAVAATLLKKQGYDVVGVHFVFFDPTWKSGFQIREIAVKIGIPLKIVDARKEFQKRIIDYFLKEYKEGRTPNPCVRCNKEMKFRLLFDFMKKCEADYVATGHYARLRREFPISNFQFPKKFQIPNLKLQISNYKLLEAFDKTKDQSYFLYRLSKKELSKIIFPLGDFKKSEVKKMAKKLKLPVAKEESQDICFLAGADTNSFLEKNIKAKRGDIVCQGGKLLGKHRGLPFYTIGQRKGIRIGGTGPYWICGKDVRKNRLVVTNDPKEIFAKTFCVSTASWIKSGIKLPLAASVQIRYHSERIPAIIKSSGKSGILKVEAKKPFRAVAPGQSAVFYRNGEVLGGGIIKS